MYKVVIILAVRVQHNARYRQSSKYHVELDILQGRQERLLSTPSQLKPESQESTDQATSDETRKPFEYLPGDSLDLPLETFGNDDDNQRGLTRAGKIRKAQLLEKAAILFAENGFEETRVVDIMRSAGVSKGLFYWYFENKEALFKELVIATRRGLRAHQSEAAGSETNPLNRLALAIAASVEFVIEHFNLYSLISRTTLRSEMTGLRIDSASYYKAETARAIKACQDAGLARSGEPDEMAAGVNGAVTAYATLGVGQDKEMQRHLGRECAEFCLRAIVQDPLDAVDAVSMIGR